MKDLPKNIRQIGNVSDSTKVYIEDYVDTYLNQLRHREEKEIQGIFFVGEIKKHNAEEYYLISGALLMQGIKMEGNNIIVEKDTWKLACKEAKESFEGKNIIGWALIKEGIEIKLTPQIAKIDEKFFMKKSRVLMLLDHNEKEETVYVHRFNSLMEMQGYYIYYEKNPLMQEYMISRRKESALPPSETYEDRAAKNFRNIINKKEEERAQESVKRYKLSGVASLVAIVAIGLVSLNEYETLQHIGSGILSGFNNEEEGKDTNQSVEVSEQVKISVDQLKPVIEDEIDESAFADSSDSENIPLLSIEETDENLGEGTDEVPKESEGPEASVQTEADVEETSGQAIEYFEHKVMLGDTLVSICREYYGDIQLLTEICEFNDISVMDYIVEGQVIKLPEK